MIEIFDLCWIFVTGSALGSGENVSAYEFSKKFLLLKLKKKFKNV